ncbi:Fe-S cluster assembly protein SufD [Chitinophaga sp. SYP-B3965]|uniref:Fe-S cluster assembly protein SufD n=1 Tax=Chitinophaga sp. SYP-B3965 TaxID=2663120 RepID=UPI0012999B0D|nr:Fe-S cluster assembly protein SufD [Chitinophaga sp. SYP-B3965]MRG45098.1 Fe-S cluster assembly protein SufD [Chitinophaga sp. SYP-B3965]
MTTIASNISLIDQLPEQFSELSSNAQWLDARKTAFARFQALGGFPTVKTEDWKYTNVTPYLKNGISLQLPVAPALSAEQLEATGLLLPDTYRVVLLNGVLQPQFSELPSATQVTVCKMSEAANEPAFIQYFNKSQKLEEHHFAQLNTALFNDGLFIEAKAKALVEQPIHVIHLYHNTGNLFVQPRHLWVVQPGAQLKIIESAAGLNLAGTVFVNSVIEAVTSERAQLDHYQLQTGCQQTRAINQTLVQQHGKSLYNNYTFTLCEADLIRNNLNISLDAERTETHLYGFYIATGNQLVDNHTSVDHRMPHCESNELYRGVMMDKATGVFNGKIYVHEDAQKTNAFQQNNNLVISPDANIYTKPQLEIFADDVKCSHGTTIGQVSEEALFYLKARGIGDETARIMLVKAFAFDITAQVKIPAVRKQVELLASRYLAAAVNN